MPSDRFEDQMERFLAKMDRQNELLEHLIDQLIEANRYRERSDKRADDHSNNL
jgi:uncharacterized protein YukE